LKGLGVGLGKPKIVTASVDYLCLACTSAKASARPKTVSSMSTTSWWSRYPLRKGQGKGPFVPGAAWSRDYLRSGMPWQREAGGGFGRPAFFGEARSSGGGDRGQGKEAGPVHVANQFFGRLGMEEVLAQAGLNERALFSLDSTIYLYDLTSTYFEGRCERNEEARRGYSRDKRPECNRVLVALVVDRKGFPIKHEVFERNRADSTTLWAMLEALERNQGRKEGVTVVVDRGMPTEGTWS